MIKMLVSFLGHDGVSQFSPHSFHRGGVIFVFSCGVPGETIKLQGEWASKAYMVYLAPSLIQQMQLLAPVTKRIGKVSYIKSA